MSRQVLITTAKYRGYEPAARAWLQRHGCDLIDYIIPQLTSYDTAHQPGGTHAYHPTTLG